MENTNEISVLENKVKDLAEDILTQNIDLMVNPPAEESYQKTMAPVLYGKEDELENKICVLNIEIERLSTRIAIAEQTKKEEISNLQTSLEMLLEERNESLFLKQEQIDLMTKFTPEIRAFYQHLFLKLSHTFLAIAVLNSGLVVMSGSKWQRLTKGITLAGSFIPTPFVSPAISLVMEGINIAIDVHRQKKIERVATRHMLNMFCIERFCERVARRLASCAVGCSGFNQLSVKGAITLSEYGVKDVLDQLKHSRDDKIELGQENLIKMILSCNHTGRDLETKVIGHGHHHVAPQEIFQEIGVISLRTQPQPISGPTNKALLSLTQSNIPASSQLSSVSSLAETSELRREIADLKLEVAYLKQQVTALNSDMARVMAVINDSTSTQVNRAGPTFFPQSK